uniref:contractile injection system protein, VgrG/Pvc8 family n=1 Tax=Paenibacillus turpanensis TaxID=2689078 RepID=UPI0031331D97
MKAVNEHAKLYIEGIIPEEMKDSYIEQSSEGDLLEVQIREADGRTKTLFHGLVSRISVRSVRGIYYLELEGISHTSLLDIRQVSRSFQHEAMSYSSLIEQVIADYDGSDCLDHASGTSTLGGFTLQYLETDWQFLKRMASRFGAVLIPEASASAPKFHFGLPDGRLWELPSEPFVVARNVSEYLRTEAVEGGAAEADFTSYRVNTEQLFQLGDRVMFQEGELTVAASTARLEDGVLRYDYVLVPEEGVRQRRLYNEEVTGAALQGKILQVKGS